MKKAFLLLLILMIYLSSCSKNDIKPPNINTDDTSTNSSEAIIFDQMNIDDKFLKSEATCTSPAIYYYSSINGDIGTETFEYGNALGHSGSNNKCDRCGAYYDNIDWGPLH
ncbi:MAG: hypothetical protein ACI35S_06235 [Anaeroplasma sp.]